MHDPSPEFPQNPWINENPWEDFDAAEKSLEDQYEEIKVYNDILVRMVAGLDLTGPQKFIAERKNLAVIVTSKFREANLFLAPNLQNEPKEFESVQVSGSCAIYGEVPKRTQALIGDLLRGTNAKRIARVEPAGTEVWMGYDEVEGKAIDFIIEEFCEYGVSADEPTKTKITTVRVRRNLTPEERNLYGHTIQSVIIESTGPTKPNKLQKLARKLGKFLGDSSE